MELIFVIKKRILQGTTPRLKFQILNDETPSAGFQPNTLVMSVYDVPHSTTVITTPPTVASVSMNGQTDVDVSGSCDASGNVDIRLDSANTGLTATQAEKCTAKGIRRLVLFEWSWDSGSGKGAGIFDLSIFPTYKPA